MKNKTFSKLLGKKVKKSKKLVDISNLKPESEVEQALQLEPEKELESAPTLKLTFAAKPKPSAKKKVLNLLGKKDKKIQKLVDISNLKPGSEAEQALQLEPERELEFAPILKPKLSIKKKVSKLLHSKTITHTEDQKSQKPMSTSEQKNENEIVNIMVQKSSIYKLIKKLPKWMLRYSASPSIIQDLKVLTAIGAHAATKPDILLEPKTIIQLIGIFINHNQIRQLLIQYVERNTQININIQSIQLGTETTKAIIRDYIKHIAQNKTTQKQAHFAEQYKLESIQPRDITDTLLQKLLLNAPLLKAALKHRDANQKNSTTQEAKLVQKQIADLISPLLDVVSTVIVHPQRVEGLLHIIIPLIVKDKKHKDAVPISKIMELSTEIVSDIKTLNALKNILKNHNISTLAPMLATLMLKKKSAAIIPAISEHQLYPFMQSGLKVVSTIINGLTPEAIASIKKMIPAIIKIIDEPTPDDKKSQKDIDKEKMQCVFQITDAAIKILSNNGLGEAIYNDIKALIDNNRPLLKEVIKAMMDAAHSPITLDPDLLLDAIANQQNIKALHAAYEHVRNENYIRAAGTIIFHSKDARSITFSIIWQSLSNRVKQFIVPNFVRRYFANDSVVEYLNASIPKCKKVDGRYDVLSAFDPTKLNKSSGLSKYSLQHKFFKGYDLSEVSFKDCRLASFNLRQVIFNKAAHFENALLQDCNFTGINFRDGATFNKAVIQNCDFTGAIFKEDLDFSKAKIDCKSLVTLITNHNLTKDQFKGCKLDMSKNTLLRDDREALKKSDIGKMILDNTFHKKTPLNSINSELRSRSKTGANIINAMRARSYSLKDTRAR